MLINFFEIVKKYSVIKSQSEFMSWFLGSDILKSDTHLKRLFKQECELTLEDRIKIAEYTEWSLDPFYNKKEFEEELRVLYKNTFNEPEERLPLKKILIHFLYQYLFGTVQPERMFKKYEGGVCNNYVQPREYQEIFRSAWNESNIMVLYGKGGIGKSQLVKSYIQENADQYKEICVLDECRSIQEGLLTIPFWFEQHKKFEEIREVLKCKDTTSLLVIDIPVLHERDISFIEKYLLDLELRIIITTHQRVSVEEIYQKRFDSLDDQTLREIFDKNVGKRTYKISDGQFAKLLDIVDRNTLVVALLGKSICREEIPVEELVNEQEWIWVKTKVKTVHAHVYGERDAKTPVYHIRAILDRYGIMRDEYSELAIWCKNEMKTEALKKWCEFADRMSDVLKEAYESGLIEFADGGNQVIKMHSLIADAIWKFYGIKYRDYQKNIKLFLENVKWGRERELEYGMLYDGIYNVFQRFNFELQKSKSKRTREAYYDNLFQMIDFSVQSGNFYGAERLIYFWDKMPESNKYKKILWEFEISFARGDVQTLQHIEKKYRSLSETPKTSAEISDEVGFAESCREFLRIILNWYIRRMRADAGNTEELEQLVDGYKKVSGAYDEILMWDPYKNYYIIVMGYVHGLELEQNGQLNDYYRILGEMGLSDLIMKVKLEILYWQMRFSIDNTVGNERRKKEISAVNELEREYRNRLWPTDVEILYRQVEVLKTILEQDREALCDRITDFSGLFDERVSMENMTSEMKKTYEAIPDIVKRIKAIYN